MKRLRALWGAFSEDLIRRPRSAVAMREGMIHEATIRDVVASALCAAPRYEEAA